MGAEHASWHGAVAEFVVLEPEAAPAALSELHELNVSIASDAEAMQELDRLGAL